jgi:hypothetical protein
MYMYSACYNAAHNWLHTSKQTTPFVPDSPKQATGLKDEGGMGLVVGLSSTEKPVGQVEHSRIEPTEHLTE